MGRERIGEWAFIIGAIIAIIAGFSSGVMDSGTSAIVTTALVILGIVVGFLNIGKKDTDGFLLASATLMLVGTARLDVLLLVGPYLSLMLKNLSAFVAPAALVVALKAFYNTASKPSKR